MSALRDAGAHYVLLPRHGFRFREELDDAAVRELFAPHTPRGEAPARLLAAVPRAGPRLVAAHPLAVAALREHPDLRVSPVALYHPTVVRRAPTASIAAAAAAQQTVTLRVLSQSDGAPIPGADVAAIADLETGQGLAGVTDAEGRVSLSLAAPDQTFAAFFVTPRAGFWSSLARDVALRDGMEIRVAPLDLSFVDALRHFFGLPPPGTGEGVRVGVVDTGVGPHPDLVLAGGRNLVLGEQADSFGDNGLGHGTHVAGIVGARGTPPHGVRGLAPGSSLFSYRVYAQGRGTCTNFAVIQAIDQAVTDGCDLVNLSLELDATADADEPVHEAIAAAYERGTVLIAAAGNTTFGPRGAVGYPAADPLCLGAAAMGREGFFPPGTLETGEVAAPFGSDPRNFAARFSNAGTQVAFTGPGVGIISTFPDGYAVLDGTSMACPAVCGRAATLLAGSRDLLAAPRARQRAAAIVDLLARSATLLGLGADFEGHGLP